MPDPIRIFLDDERPTPAGYVRAYWPDEVIARLQSGAVVDEVSLDHDLGDDARGTGYDVLTWVEEQVATAGFVPPRLVVHSANPAAGMRMRAAIEQINRLYERRVGAKGEGEQGGVRMGAGPGGFVGSLASGQCAIPRRNALTPRPEPRDGPDLPPVRTTDTAPRPIRPVA